MSIGISNGTRHRTKRCAECQTAAPVLFRVQKDDSQQWFFVCEACLPNVKDNNPHYTYGGTWKANKKR